MVPVPQASPQRQPVRESLPFEVVDDDRPARRPRVPVGTELDMGALLRFKSMMAVDGHEVHLARMCYDRLYAYERIACAHTSADDTLRRLALELFQIYHRREALGVATQ